MLGDEVIICIRQLGSHLGNDSSFKTPSYKLFFQFFFTPLYNAIRIIEGDVHNLDSKQPSFPLDQVQLVSNYDILKTAMELERYMFVHLIVTMQISCEFLSRNMDKALKVANTNFELFLVSRRRCILLFDSQ